MRCMHEASQHQDNIFLTLTYDDKSLPAKGSLDGPIPASKPGAKPGAFATFLKRLRKEVSPARVRYFHVGEYGTINNRPHYHALLFGYRPEDASLLSMRGEHHVFTSETLRALWPQGLHEFGEVTYASAGYCAGYMKRKMTGSWAKQKYGEREPEYGTMSRNPGIGAKWIDKFQCEVYPADGVVVRGAIVKPPRYYDLRTASSHPVEVECARFRRHAKRQRENESPERLAVMETCAVAREDLNERRVL